MTKRAERRGPAIATGDQARASLLRGAAQMTGLLRPTLGPLTGPVLLAGATGKSRPELLTRGGLIARRTVELVDPFENMGAMLVRQLVWRVHERVGDGTATAAVIGHRLLVELTRAIAAGAS